MRFRYRVKLRNSTVTGKDLLEAAKTVLGDRFHLEISVRTDDADLLAVGISDPASDDFVIAVGSEYTPEIDPKKSYSVIHICSYNGFKFGHDWQNNKPQQRTDQERQEIALQFKNGMEKVLNAQPD